MVGLKVNRFGVIQNGTPGVVSKCPGAGGWWVR